MTEQERRECEVFARGCQAAGNTLIVPQRLHDAMVAAGIDTSAVIVARPIPTSRSRRNPPRGQYRS